MPRPSQARFALFFAGATLVPLIALVWLGARLLQQDRDIERQRRRERLEVAAARVALDLGRQLQAIEDGLGRPGGLRLLPTGFDAADDAAARVFYQPDGVLDADVVQPALGAAERLEYLEHNLSAAAAAYRSMAIHEDTRVRAAALVGLARVLRQRGDRSGALDAYDDLKRLGSERVAGQPAALVAMQGRCKVFEEAGDVVSQRRAANELAQTLRTGEWLIDRATFGVYREMLSRWGVPYLDDAQIVRTDAAIRIWQMWRSGQLPAHGRRVIGAETGAALAIWITQADAPRLWVAKAADLETLFAPLWREHALLVSASDADGARLFGPSAPAGAISLLPGDTGLPFVLSAGPDGTDLEAAEAARRMYLVGGLSGALLLVVVAAYGLFRTTSRERELARQQSDFVSAVSHEFRTPLTSMRHLTDLLVSRGIVNEERRVHYYRLLAHETERLHRMVEALLSFGRIEAGAHAFHLEPEDPSALLAAVVGDFRSDALAKDRDIACDVSADLPRILADRETLSRAIWNLLENAAKYSDAGTPIRAFAKRHNDAVLIGIGDRGIGIATTERERIFKTFVRGAEATRTGVRGVGIGLALVKRIVEAHGGSVHIESEPGRGSTFTLVIPCRAS